MLTIRTTTGCGSRRRGVCSICAHWHGTSLRCHTLHEPVMSERCPVTLQVNDAADHKSCSYPDNSSPFCEAGNPCGFTCSDGFTPFPAKNPTSCVCESPKTVCNGVCGDFKGCASSGPKKRDSQIRKRAVCEDGLTPCGVFGWQGQRSSQAWECVDTTSDLESCTFCSYRPKMKRS